MPAMAVMAQKPATAPPSSIANCQAYYNADVGTTIATGVSQWNDQSGNSNTLAQGTGAQQPTLETNWSNGKNAIKFDGSNDSLFRATLAAGTIAQPTTMIAVGESAGVALRLISDSRDGANRQFLVDDGAYVGHWAGSYCQCLRTWSSAEKMIYSATFNGASSTGRLLRGGFSLVTATATTGSGSINGLTIGNAFNDAAGFSGRVATYALYTRALNAAEIFLLETWGKAYYAITTA
jgi:hypothetical protein